MTDTQKRATPRNILLDEILAKAVKIAITRPMVNVINVKGIVYLMAPSINGPMDVDAMS